MSVNVIGPSLYMRYDGALSERSFVVDIVDCDMVVLYRKKNITRAIACFIL